MVRPDKIHRYMNIARVISEISPCTRRKCGVVLIKNDAIVSTGYNGSCRGSKNCGEDVSCLKDIHKEAPLASYVHCPAIHGEANAIINAARTGTSTIGSTLFLFSSTLSDSGEPCIFCRRVIVNAGVYDCYFMNGKNELSHKLISEWVESENKWMDKEEHGN